jgi:membrane-bound metal-dependent hydrolase YbcI (DUF457 family)
MKQFEKVYKWLIIMIGLTGTFLSILLHELFHYIMHAKDFIRFYIFPSNGNIAQVVTYIPKGYNMLQEEIVAYIITSLVLLITMLLIVKILLANDNKTIEK